MPEVTTEVIKVDIKRFKECMDYINLINATPLDCLDLSECCSKIKPAKLKRLKQQWKFIGLNNKDFIALYSDEAKN